MNMKKRTRIRLVICFLLLPVMMKAQGEAEDNSFGGWHFLEVAHQFGDSKWSGKIYFEHENFQYQRLDCWFLRPAIGYKALPWLKLNAGYDYLKLPETYGHRALFDVTGTLREGQLSASLRFRYLHTWKPDLGMQDNELRTRLIVAYSIKNVPITPYMAVEIFTWGSLWRKSRHFVACTYDVTDFMQLEGFYMLTFSSSEPEHILGFGINFSI